MLVEDIAVLPTFEMTGDYLLSRMRPYINSAVARWTVAHNVAAFLADQPFIKLLTQHVACNGKTGAECLPYGKMLGKLCSGLESVFAFNDHSDHVTVCDLAEKAADVIAKLLESDAAKKCTILGPSLDKINLICKD
jgi:hypothetical protein